MLLVSSASNDCMWQLWKSFKGIKRYKESLEIQTQQFMLITWLLRVLAGHHAAALQLLYSDCMWRMWYIKCWRYQEILRITRNASTTIVVNKGLSTYYVSQFRGFSDQPSPTRQQLSSFGLPLPPSSGWRNMWTAPKSVTSSACRASCHGAAAGICN